MTCGPDFVRVQQPEAPPARAGPARAVSRSPSTCHGLSPRPARRCAAKSQSMPYRPTVFSISSRFARRAAPAVAARRGSGPGRCRGHASGWPRRSRRCGRCRPRRSGPPPEHHVPAGIGLLGLQRGPQPGETAADHRQVRAFCPRSALAAARARPAGRASTGPVAPRQGCQRARVVMGLQGSVPAIRYPRHVLPIGVRIGRLCQAAFGRCCDRSYAVDRARVIPVGKTSGGGRRRRQLADLGACRRRGRGGQATGFSSDPASGIGDVVVAVALRGCRGRWSSPGVCRPSGFWGDGCAVVESRRRCGTEVEPVAEGFAAADPEMAPGGGRRDEAVARVLRRRGVRGLPGRSASAFGVGAEQPGQRRSASESATAALSLPHLRPSRRRRPISAGRPSRWRRPAARRSPARSSTVSSTGPRSAASPGAAPLCRARTTCTLVPGIDGSTGRRTVRCIAPARLVRPAPRPQRRVSLLEHRASRRRPRVTAAPLSPPVRGGPPETSRAAAARPLPVARANPDLR